MKMEGRGFSDLVRSTSEEVLIKSMLDNPIGDMAPSMEMLGFKNIMQPFRAGNEELFNSWLINGEVPASAIAHPTQQASMRIPSDPCASQQNVALFQEKSSNVNTHQNLRTSEGDLNDPGQYSLRNLSEEGVPPINIQMGKAWFHSSQPLTRSRPLELRRYAAMQAQCNIPEHDADRFKQDFTNMRNFYNIPMGEMPNHLQTFMPPAEITKSDTVSSLVSMLKGTLEHKKLDCKVDNGTFKGGYYDMLTSEEAARCISSIQGAGDQANFFHLLSSVSVAASGGTATIEKTLELNIDGFPTEANQIQMDTVSQEPSQSDSSTAAPTLSADFEVCDTPHQSGNTVTNCGNCRKHVGNVSSEHESKSSAEKADPTKKRRVERSRKMAEAKERNSTSSQPSDMQAVLKRCENLEKEVRSLKLNLSFMNRKDSEQAKQIEALEKQNEKLTEEKERLSEERERFVSEYGKF